MKFKVGYYIYYYSEEYKGIRWTKIEMIKENRLYGYFENFGKPVMFDNREILTWINEDICNILSKEKLALSKLKQ